LLNTISKVDDYIQIFKSIFFLRFFILAFLTKIILENFDYKKFKEFTKLLLLLVFVIIISIYLEFIYHLLIENKILDRYSGIFFSELIAAGVVLKILIAYSALKLSLIRKFQTIDLLIYLICIPAIILTNERTNIILFIFLFFLVILYSNIDFKKKLLTLLSVFLICFSFLNFNTEVKKRFLQFASYIYLSFKVEILKQPINSAQVKNKFKLTEDDFELIKNYDYFDLIYSGYVVGKNNYLLGVGFKEYRNYCINSNKFIQCNNHPHNYYSEIFAETGLVGIVFLLFNLIYILKINKTNDKRFNQIAILLIFLPFITTGSFFNNYNAMLNFFVIGCLLNQNSYKIEKKNKFKN